MMGRKLRVPPEDIMPGDFTTHTGYRNVLDVTPVYLTEGRGKKKREWLARVSLLRADGTADDIEVDAFHPKTGEPMTYTVYRAS